jgi:hypothetical protein
MDKIFDYLKKYSLYLGGIAVILTVYVMRKKVKKSFVNGINKGKRVVKYTRRRYYGRR